MAMMLVLIDSTYDGAVACSKSWTLASCFHPRFILDDGIQLCLANSTTARPEAHQLGIQTLRARACLDYMKVERWWLQVLGLKSQVSAPANFHVPNKLEFQIRPVVLGRVSTERKQVDHKSLAYAQLARKTLVKLVGQYSNAVGRASGSEMGRSPSGGWFPEGKQGCG